MYKEEGVMVGVMVGVMESGPKFLWTNFVGVVRLCVIAYVVVEVSFLEGSIHAALHRDSLVNDTLVNT